MIRNAIARLWPAVGLCALLAFWAGCSTDDGLGRRYPVSGKVTYKGAPVAKGIINFIPAKNDGRAASGTIENGNYKLTTLTPGDGAFPGEYYVTINTRELDEATAKSEMMEIAKKKGMPGGITQIPPEIQAKNRAASKGTTPVKYESINDLKATITGSTSGLNFDLKD